jgi:hypothetical protein
VEARPAYCNRGRFLVNAQSIDAAVLSIDWADGFPRYYFGVEACAACLVFAQCSPARLRFRIVRNGICIKPRRGWGSG